jgi:heat-inducible transcriptional repressor
MLSERAQILLKTLVERYIAEGQPVASRTLSEHAGLSLSSASIRHLMADLENQGFIRSPHTSAGRIPTEQGYRLFVDSLLMVKSISTGEINELKEQLPKDNTKRSLHTTSQLLSQLTNFTSLVLVPNQQETALQRVEFIALSERRILLVLVTNTGDVQNRILHTDKVYQAEELIYTANYINQHFAGKTLGHIRAQVNVEVQELQQHMSDLMRQTLEEGMHNDDDTPVLINGEHHLFNIDDLATSKLRELFAMFEQKTALLTLLNMSQRAKGVQIFIGGETGLAALADCSVVTAPYKVNNQVVGTLGVIGPTRMAYERVIPIVDITAQLLSSALSSHEENA